MSCARPVPRRGEVLSLLALVLLLCLPGSRVLADQFAEDGTHVAPVIVDGETLFLVRGITAYPAEERAALVRRRIIAAARDPGISGSDIARLEKEGQHQIYADKNLLLTVFDADAELELLDRETIADSYRDTIDDTINRYRRDRSPEVLLQNTGYALVATLVGDRVQIGDVVGTVEEIRLMVTRLRTAKNEIVVIPNSSILESDVVNYSVYARRDGVILHTTVGIGYDVPWRQGGGAAVAGSCARGSKATPQSPARHRSPGRRRTGGGRRRRCRPG